MIIHRNAVQVIVVAAEMPHEGPVSLDEFVWGRGACTAKSPVALTVAVCTVSLDT